MEDITVNLKELGKIDLRMLHFVEMTKLKEIVKFEPCLKRSKNDVLFLRICYRLGTFFNLSFEKKKKKKLDVDYDSTLP